MSFIISAAGVLIFSGLIAYDTQKIKEQYAEAWGRDVAEKVAIFLWAGEFLHLFQTAGDLLHFLGQSLQFLLQLAVVVPLVLVAQGGRYFVMKLLTVGLDLPL